MLIQSTQLYFFKPYLASCERWRKRFESCSVFRLLICLSFACCYLILWKFVNVTIVTSIDVITKKCWFPDNERDFFIWSIWTLGFWMALWRHWLLKFTTVRLVKCTCKANIIQYSTLFFSDETSVFVCSFDPQSKMWSISLQHGVVRVTFDHYRCTWLFSMFFLIFCCSGNFLKLMFHIVSQKLLCCCSVLYVLINIAQTQF